MPRSRRAPARSSASRTLSRPVSTMPARRPVAPPPAQKSGGMLSGIGSTIAQGMAFGTGSAIAHQAVGAVTNSMSGGGSSPSVAAAEVPQPMVLDMNANTLQGACAQDKQMYFDCLKTNQGDQQSCSFLYETLQACQRDGNQMSFN